MEVSELFFYRLFLTTKPKKILHKEAQSHYRIRLRALCGFSFALFAFYFFLSFSASAQGSPDLKEVKKNFSQEIKFASYLLNNREYNDALMSLHGLKSSIQSQTDSLNYFLGWTHYNFKSLDSSAFYFNQVISGSPFYHKSKFYQAFDYTYIRKFSDAKATLNEISLSGNTDFQLLNNFQNAGIALLERDYKTFDSLAAKFDYTFYPLATEQESMKEYYSDLKKVKRKSPVVAGLLSAAVPGLGKYYAGYRMQGVAALLQVGTFGAAAAESYFKKSPQAGLKSPRFIIYGSLFTIFYVGNIWGSVLSVQIKREEHFKEIDETILFNMRVPLRRIFE